MSPAIWAGAVAGYQAGRAGLGCIDRRCLYCWARGYELRMAWWVREARIAALRKRGFARDTAVAVADSAEAGRL